MSIDIRLSRNLTTRRVLPVIKNVADFIPRRVIAEDEKKENRSTFVKEAFQVQIQEIISVLAHEYEHLINDQFHGQGTILKLDSCDIGDSHTPEERELVIELQAYL
jgi:hypothetical protein